MGGILSRMIPRGRISVSLGRQGLTRRSQHGFVRGRSCFRNLIELFKVMAKKIAIGIDLLSHVPIQQEKLSFECCSGNSYST